MARPTTPLWLSRPSRFAGLDRARAFWAAIFLILLAVTAIAALPATPAGDAATGVTTPVAQRDVYLHGSVVEGIRAGGDYYAVTAAALRAGGFPLKPFVAVRLPTLAVVEAALPPSGVTALLLALAIGTVWAWFARLRTAFARPAALIAAMVLLAGGMLMFVQPELAAIHQIWAALLVALSLALRKPGRWVEAAAVALMAMLVHEVAALYVVVMAALALSDGHRREALGWAVALLVLVGVLAAHAVGMARVTGPLDPELVLRPGLHGFGAFVAGVTRATALQALPQWLGALLVALAMFGWAAWNSATGLRVLATLVAYAVLVSVFANDAGQSWTLIAAPLLLIGLAFAPDALRDCARTILDRRRVTVQRITR